MWCLEAAREHTNTHTRASSARVVRRCMQWWCSLCGYGDSYSNDMTHFRPPQLQAAQKREDDAYQGTSTRTTVHTVSLMALMC
jgi:hypothetical protein